MNIANHKKTILILIVVIALFFAYWFFYISKKKVQQDANQSANKNIKAQSTGNSQYDKDFISSLLGLSSVDLDTDILKSKAYNALNYPENPFIVDYSMESGRNNPFLPIGMEGSVVSKSNSSQQNKSTNTNTNPATTTSTAPATNTAPAPAATSTTPTPIPKRF